jgi:hypothetical protein
MPRASHKLNVRLIKDTEGGPPLVLIEAGKQALAEFGKMILDHASGEDGCGRQIYPGGPGSAFFVKTVTHGVYIHLLPCDHPTDESEQNTGRRRAKATGETSK